jgi:hypothetical protein
MPSDVSTIDTEVEKEMTFVQNAIETLLTIRSEMGIALERHHAARGARHTCANPWRYEGYLQRPARGRSCSSMRPGRGSQPALS